MLEKVIENWTSRLDYIRASRGSPMPKIIFKIPTHATSSLACSPDMTPIVHVWDSVIRHFTRDPRPAASKDELLLRIQAIWNSLPLADIQNVFDSIPRRTAELIAARGGYTKC
ncbi:transposable element Tcb1 transposase [Trichonephila clavipes]|nr:transposable element Tcb1 transposase [Trichonephila clavipes]